MDTTPPTTAAILYGAASHLEQHGWYQGGLRPHTGTITMPPPLCAAAAISVVACDDIFGLLYSDTNPGAKALTYLAQHIRRDTTTPGRTAMGIVAMWNDHPQRTADEVITELRAAAHDWETEHATTTV